MRMSGVFPMHPRTPSTVSLQIAWVRRLAWCCVGGLCRSIHVINEVAPAKKPAPVHPPLQLLLAYHRTFGQSNNNSMFLKKF